jgi:hypothetical protein
MITVGGLLLTIVGLVLSIVALMAARQQTTDLKLISNSLSTRYLGQFPDYFPDVIDVIKSANKELKLVCTIPIHGVCSKRDGWLLVRAAPRMTGGRNGRASHSGRLRSHVSTPLSGQSPCNTGNRFILEYSLAGDTCQSKSQLLRSRCPTARRKWS